MKACVCVEEGNVVCRGAVTGLAVVGTTKLRAKRYANISHDFALSKSSDIQTITYYYLQSALWILHKPLPFHVATTYFRNDMDLFFAVGKIWQWFCFLANHPEQDDDDDDHRSTDEQHVHSCLVYPQLDKY